MNCLIFLDTNTKYNSRTSGHAYSAEAIWTSFRKQAISSVFVHCTNITNHSINQNRALSGFVLLDRSEPYHVFKSLVSITRNNNISYILTYDITQYEPMLRFISAFFCIPLIHCKPGGPFQIKWQKVLNLIVYTEEDRKHFKSVKNICVIPNRIIQQNFFVDENLVREVHNFKQTRFLFLRVGRFAEAYESVFTKTVGLIDRLTQEGFAVCALLIGYPQDQRVVSRIRTLILERGLEKSVRLETAEPFTDRANKFIPMADAVVGVGRGAMEACLATKPVLFESLNNDQLSLLTAETAASAVWFNFSPRVIIDSDSHLKSLSEIRQIIICQKKRSASAYFAQQLGNNLYDASKGPEKIEAFARRSRVYTLILIAGPSFALAREFLAKYFGRAKLGLRHDK